MIYLDNAATTKVLPEILEAMLPCYETAYGNPSAIYSLGSGAKKLINQSKRQIAATLGVNFEEIYFTSGGSEADNWAIKAVAEAYETKGKHIITSAIEHHAVLHTCEYLEKKGFSVTYLPVDAQGIVDPEEVKRAIRKDTILISVMFANNEIGTLQPIEEIGKIAKEHGVLFHSDAVQAYGQIPFDVKECNVDLLSVSGHKLNGPKGIGFLYVKNTCKLGSFIHGGNQERGRRAGTENVPAIVGLGKAAEVAFRNMEEKIQRETVMRNHLLNRLETEIPNCIVNGDREKRLPGNVHVSFPGIEGESLLIMLDMKGICASGGSACTVGSEEPSHVLLAIGADPERAKGSLRLTLSMENTMEEIDQTVEAIKEIVDRLRMLTAR